MKTNIITLIKDDIKISRLTNALDRLYVPTAHYPLGNSKVIFSLMGIPDEETNLEIYYKLIEQGADLDKYDSNEKIEELAEGIFKQLMGIKKLTVIIYLINLTSFKSEDFVIAIF